MFWEQFFFFFFFFSGTTFVFYFQEPLFILLLFWEFYVLYAFANEFVQFNSYFLSFFTLKIRQARYLGWSRKPSSYISKGTRKDIDIWITTRSEKNSLGKMNRNLLFLFTLFFFLPLKFDRLCILVDHESVNIFNNYYFLLLYFLNSDTNRKLAIFCQEQTSYLGWSTKSSFQSKKTDKIHKSISELKKIRSVCLNTIWNMIIIFKNF